MNLDCRPPAASGYSDRGLATRQRILAAAAVELAAKGEVEVASVAQRAGVSMGLPYRYFGTRSGLLSAVVDDFYQRLDATVVRREFEGATWQARERARVVAFVDYLYEEPLATVVLGCLHDSADIAPRVSRYLRGTIELAAHNIAEGQRNGELSADRDPNLLAAAIIGAMSTTVMVAQTWRPQRDCATVANQLWEFVRGAVGVRHGDDEPT